ncbi:flagellar protein FlbD [bacterium]|nr:flagellar protein FlbD [bacterium]
MIKLTRLDGETLVVNAGLIETIGCGAGTLVALTSGRKLLVRESPDEVARLALAYQARLQVAVAAEAAALATAGG